MFKVGEVFNYLTIEKIISPKQYLCKCSCGNHIKVSLEYLSDNRHIHSCGHYKSSSEYNSLYIYWKQFSNEEQKEWNNNFSNFVNWTLENGYNKLLITRKILYKQPYSKSNITFGIYINSEFFIYQNLKKIGYHIVNNKWVTSKKVKNKTISYDKFTKFLNETDSPRKSFPYSLFKEFKKVYIKRLT